MFLLLTLNIFLTFSSVSIVDFEQVSVSWERNCCGRSSRSHMICKLVLLKISRNSQENTCFEVSFLWSCGMEACNFFKKEIPAEVFFCELCEIVSNRFLTEHLWTTPSVIEKEMIIKDILANSSKSTKETLEKSLKFVQSWQERL